MHQYFEDMFGSVEFGAAARTHAVSVDGGGGAPVPVQPQTKRPATDPVDEAVKGAKGDKGDKAQETTPAAKPTPTEQVREVIKDGAVGRREKTTFDSKPVAKALDAETGRLTDAVIKAHGNDLERDGSGRLVLEDGAPVVDEDSAAQATKYEELVQDLGETSGTHGLDVLNGQIRELRSSKSPVGIDSLIALRDERRGAEQLVVGGIQDKLSLVGALEAERLDLTAGAPKVAANDYEQLRTRAGRWIEQFNANGGRFDGSENFITDAFGKVTGTDHQETEVDFDMLAERFHESPEALEQFAGAQGLRDGDLQGRSAKEVEAYLGEIEDPSEANDIALRYQAAQRLEGIFTTYTEARDVVEGTSAQVEQIDTEIELLNGAVSTEADVLSPSQLKALDASLAPKAGIIERADVEPAGASKDAKVKGDKPEGGNVEGGGKGQKDNPNIDPGMPTRTREVEIDYTDPEYSGRVLRQAQKQDLLPAQHVEFDKQGQAVYTVQPGDSYWAISDQSDGKGAGGFDTQHFLDNVNTNSQRLGRDPQVGIIHPNEQVIIQNRSLEQLVKLLELPATEQVEGPAFMQRSGGLQAY